MNNKNNILQGRPPAEKYDVYTFSEIFPKDRVSATSVGSWTLLRLLLMDDVTLCKELCRVKLLRGSVLLIFSLSELYSLSDKTVFSSGDSNNFVKSKPEA